MGIVFVQNFAAGRDASVESLKAENDAVFVAVGAWRRPCLWDGAGDDADGVIGGINFLKDASEGKDTGIKGKTGRSCRRRQHGHGTAAVQP